MVDIYSSYPNDWLKTVTDSDSKTTTYKYDKAGNRTKVIHHNGVVGEYTYSPNNY